MILFGNLWKWTVDWHAPIGRLNGFHFRWWWLGLAAGLLSCGLAIESETLLEQVGRCLESVFWKRSKRNIDRMRYKRARRPVLVDGKIQFHNYKTK